MAKIFAVILTYNRKELLSQCLHAVLAQTHACDTVMVIDNASSDGTEAMLRNEWSEHVRYHVLSKNIGASGGFNAAIRLAYQQGADFIWLMDDDVIPAPDALERLVEADNWLTTRKMERAFVLSTAWTEDGHVTNVPRIDTRPNRNGYENWPVLLEQRMVPVTRATFVSILLPRPVVAHHGLPLAPMFIWGEDSEYTMRITRDRPGYVVADSKVVHLRQVAGTISLATETSPTRIKYHRHLVRNQMYTWRRYAPTLDFVQHTIRQFQQLARLVKARKFGKAKIVMMGLAESLWFAPKAESADASVESLGITVSPPHKALMAVDNVIRLDMALNDGLGEGVVGTPSQNAATG